jgi:3-oxoadipate enol-lactonase
MYHSVFLYDLRGHGESDIGEADGSLRQLSDDLVAFMDVIEMQTATLAGFSLGGTIAMRAAIDHPERIAGLALVATSSRVNSAAAAWYRERAEAVDKGDPMLRETLDEDTAEVYRQRPEEIPDGLMIRRQSTADPAGYANACRAMISLHDEPLDSELIHIRARTVIMAGDADQHCPPRASEIIASRIDGSTLRVLPGTGHPIPVERPSEVAEEIHRISDG